MKTIKYPISECMEWTLDGQTLSEAITDKAEQDLGVVEEEGTIAVYPYGSDFVAEFTPADKFKVGDRVWWTDPEKGLASGWGKITHIQEETPGTYDDDAIISLSLEVGGEAEVLPHEIRLKK